MRYLTTLALAIVTTLFLGVGEATAEDPRLKFSETGTGSWSPQPPELFAQAPVIVPGDSTTDGLWIRNDTPWPALVRMQGTLETLTTNIGDEAGLTLSARDEDGRLISKSDLTRPGQCVALLAGTLSPGEERQLQAAVSVDWEAPNPVMRGKLRVPFEVRLTDPNADLSKRPDCIGQYPSSFPQEGTGPGTSTSGLPNAGGRFSPSELALLLGAGWLLIVLGIKTMRRREQEPIDEQVQGLP